MADLRLRISIVEKNDRGQEAAKRFGMRMAWNQGASLLTNLLNHDTVAIHQSIDTTCHTGFGLRCHVRREVGTP